MIQIEIVEVIFITEGFWDLRGCDRLARGDSNLTWCINIPEEWENSESRKVGASKVQHPEANGGSASVAFSREEGGVSGKLLDLRCSAGFREEDPMVGWMCQDISA